MFTRMLRLTFRSSFQIQRLNKSSSISPSKQTATMVESKPIETAIRKALDDKLQPIHVEVINESYMHNVPKGSETHFKVLVVSDKFENLPLIKRHRLVNEIVKDALQGDFVHALSIEAKASGQWNPQYNVEPSPNCRGGFGK